MHSSSIEDEESSQQPSLSSERVSTMSRISMEASLSMDATLLGLRSSEKEVERRSKGRSVEKATQKLSLSLLRGPLLREPKK
jgi:hypothetical protein